MIRGFAVTAMLLSSVATAAAAPPSQCYRPAEIEAEQAVRFQTELMVLSDTCRHSSYVHFRQRNAALLAGYQRQLVDRFRRNGGNAEGAYDRYVTRLANEMALRLGSERPAALCRRSADFLAKADHLSKSGFRRYVAEQAAKHEGDYRHCAG